jgi:hypothetical protein
MNDKNNNKAQLDYQTPGEGSIVVAVIQIK